jgi:hypothetical protein
MFSSAYKLPCRDLVPIGSKTETQLVWPRLARAAHVDPSGAAVQQAEGSVQELATGTYRRFETSASGTYTLEFWECVGSFSR